MPLGLSSASLSTLFAPNPADIGGLVSYINIPASRNKLASSKKNQAHETSLPPHILLLLLPSLDHSSPQSSSGLLWDAGVLVVAMVIEEHYCHAQRSSTEWVSPAWETQRIHQRLFSSCFLTPLHGSQQQDGNINDCLNRKPQMSPAWRAETGKWRVLRRSCRKENSVCAAAGDRQPPGPGNSAALDGAPPTSSDCGCIQATAPAWPVMKATTEWAGGRDTRPAIFLPWKLPT
ncbi:uncharacterized protein LOC119864631 isoform X1 [Canis lupus familiaris]|uniref:uncharacterized protein LOC119864631 isoform X1 n=1 Tax=Canis lupus familiaris TaxID=9615 RepID=UPI0018F65AA7|nr:uncharacterized protein LOC119864631 isoform X1 [Canis lupus familiaris]XP_038282836.1 uncharacterized protein LOC119864631 isoform X1 [Canis lupus familiaris]XP_038421548.1 uncharacterized protein LOC119864631 isoform X1 [Canis lupus familiaris]XP_038421549.1 uncharacterized protein LOC119864631 isoform X1 [Canis lupus familiaris]